ncbi:MAG: hypothetical protein ACO3JL_06775, partial [Myxococcota bacterium]
MTSLLRRPPSAMPRLAGALRTLLASDDDDPLHRVLPYIEREHFEAKDVIAVERLVSLLPPSTTHEREAFAIALVGLLQSVAEGSSGVELGASPLWQG